MWIRVDLKLRVAKDGRGAWLRVGFNPTSLTIGNNTHPAAFFDPQTGVADVWPSSSWAAMTRAFRLGFAFLAALAAPDDLFDAATQLAIARGDFHLESVQYAANKPAAKVTDFLQVGAVIYGQTIARGRGIINNAKHLGLRFKPYHPPDQDPHENWLSGFMLQKLQGKKLHVSVAFYDKLVSLQQKHQETTLSLAEAQTVNQSVREDITAHSSFILTIVAAAREKLANMDATDRQFFALISLEEFLRGPPTASVWWLQRAIYVLSHWRQQGRWVRYSFGTWLVPFVEQKVLHLDVVASITTEGYYALLALQDPIALAWRSDPTPGAADWAGRLARAAGCKRSTVYNRRETWRKKYGIDIAYPLQMYSDILYFGHNSIAQPENITALMVAIEQEEGDEAVRLHAEELAAFERKRVQIVNPALVSRPRAMELKLPPRPSPSPPSDLRNGRPATINDDLPPDFEDLGEAEPLSLASARPQESRAQIQLHARRLPPPPPPAKKVRLKVRRRPPPPSPPARRVVLRARSCPPPPAPPVKKTRLHALRLPPPPPPAKKTRLRALHPPPSAQQVGLKVRRRSLPPPTSWNLARDPPPPTPPPSQGLPLRGWRAPPETKLSRRRKPPTVNRIYRERKLASLIGLRVRAPAREAPTARTSIPPQRL
jgi:hypothetical protein